MSVFVDGEVFSAGRDNVREHTVHSAFRLFVIIAVSGAKPISRFGVKKILDYLFNSAAAGRQLHLNTPRAASGANNEHDHTTTGTATDALSALHELNYPASLPTRAFARQVGARNKKSNAQRFPHEAKEFNFHCVIPPQLLDAWNSSRKM